MKTFTKSLSLVSIGSLLAVMAHAQVPTLPPTSPTNPTATGVPTPGVEASAPTSGNVDIRSGASGTVTTPGAPNLGTDTAGGVYVPEAGAEATSTHRQSRGDARAAGEAELSVPSIMESTTSSTLSATLDAGPTVRAIESRSVEARDQLAAEIDQRLDASSNAMAALKRQARNLDDEAQAEFNAAIKDVEMREKQLKQSAKNARKATADNWEEARSAVSADYSAYAQAAMRAEAAAAGAKAGSLSGARGSSTLERSAAERE